MTSEEPIVGLPERKFAMPNRAPSFFHWAAKNTATTYDGLGFWQKEYSSQPHPERPPGFFHVRPLSPTPCYDGKPNYWGALSGDHCRAGSWYPGRPRVDFCPPDTKNVYGMLRGYESEYVRPTAKIRKTKYPVGVWLSFPDCNPTPAYLKLPPKGSERYLANILPIGLVHCLDYPQPPRDMHYSIPEWEQYPADEKRCPPVHRRPWGIKYPIA